MYYIIIGLLGVTAGILRQWVPLCLKKRSFTFKRCKNYFPIIITTSLVTGGLIFLILAFDFDQTLKYMLLFVVSMFWGQVLFAKSIELENPRNKFYKEMTQVVNQK
jgi:hypothetical protein